MDKDDQAKWPWGWVWGFGTLGPQQGDSRRMHRQHVWVSVCCFVFMLLPLPLGPLLGTNLVWLARALMVPGFTIIWISGFRYIRSLDELSRRLHMEAAAYAYGACFISLLAFIVWASPRYAVLAVFVAEISRVAILAALSKRFA